MSKTTEKLGQPVLTLTGQMKRSMIIYNTNRKRRDPDYEAQAEARKLKRQAIHQAANKRRGGGAANQPKRGNNAPQFTKFDQVKPARHLQA